MDQTDKKICTACQGELELKRKNFPLGGDGWGGLSSMLAVQFNADVYVCTQCDKVELYAAQVEEDKPQETVKCKVCGAEHSPLIGCPRCALNNAGSYWSSKPKEKKTKRPPWEKG